MSESKLVLMDLSTQTISAEVIESTLLAYGIQVVRMTMGGHSVYPTGPLTWIDLYVPEDRLAESLAIVERLAQQEEIPTGEMPADSEGVEDGGAASQG